VTRALRHAWTVFRFAIEHRAARRITVEMAAEYPLTESEAIDWEWRTAQREVKH